MTTSSRARRWWKVILWFGASAILIVAGLVALLFLILNRVPSQYPAVSNPIDVAHLEPLKAGLANFDSPYIGHTGSWDGKGGGMFGASKVPDLEKEKAMHLHWTFMAVYWSALEPKGPVDLEREVPEAWKELDAFVIAAHDHGLNILMQAPVIGGNAGGPPTWAGRREKGKSAPANMEAAAAFAGKLAARYAPGGTLARQQGWGDTFGVRAWELDNEPDGYLTHWKGQAGDYAEFVTKSAEAIRKIDAKALLIGPGTMGGGHAGPWIEGALDARSPHGSAAYCSTGLRYSIGPTIDVVSFHIYEGLDSAFSGTNRTVEVVFDEIRRIFEANERGTQGFYYPRKTRYWQTEGNFDFFGVMSEERRASWRWQFFTRAFAAGISKVVVMDASKKEQVAVRTYVDSLPNPFPMRRADSEVKTVTGNAAVFLHEDTAGRVWVLWASDAKDAGVEIPVKNSAVLLRFPNGGEANVTATNGKAIVHLSSDSKMPPPVLVIDRQ